MPMILAPTLPPRSPAFSASGHDRCRRRSLKLVSITELVDTSHHRRKNRTVPHPAKPRKAAHTGGRPPVELCAVGPDAVQDYGKLAGHGDGGLLASDAFD